MSKVLAVTGLVFSAVVPFSAADTTPPPSGKITIDVVKVNGNGCPKGTAAVAVSPDNTSFTVSYSRFLAQVGVGAKPGEFHKKCQLHLRVLNPPDYAYGIARVDYRGFASLASGATGVEQANYNFEEMPAKEFTKHTYTGPLDDSWQATDAVAPDSIVHGPCRAKRNLLISTELRVNAGTSDPAKTTSFLVMDSTDGDMGATYRFSWRKCTPLPRTGGVRR